MNFKTFIKQNTKGMFTDLGNLNEDPKTWGLNRNTYETNEGPKIDISGEIPEDKKLKNCLFDSCSAIFFSNDGAVTLL